jgi:hypothetical protein
MHSKMQFRRTLAATLLAAASLVLASPTVLAQTPTASAGPQMSPKRLLAEAMSAAQRDFAQFAAHQLQTRGGGAPIDFPLDISDLQELKEAKVEYGFAMHTIDPADLVAGRSTMQRMVKPINQWRFVIMLRNRPIGMATVERHNGRYDTVAYGAAVLAKDVDALAGLHGNADKSNLRFVRIFQARSDLLEVVEVDGRARFAPMHSARESLLLQQRASKDGKRADALLDEAELLQPLRAAVKQNLEASR